MKKFLVVLLVLILLAVGIAAYYHFTQPSPAELLKIASWNIRVFSDNSRDDTELQQICNILLPYDFVAVIELRDEQVLLRTVAMLKSMGRSYDYLISPPIGRGVKERYAFLYDKAMVSVVEPGQPFPDPDDVFIREPYYATFRAGEFDFTAIAVHIIWGNTVAARRAEILKMGDVYQRIQSANPSEQDIILMGDFNREPEDAKSYQNLNSIPSMTHLLRAPQKSHVLDSSLYDNIWFQADHLAEYRGSHGIDRFDETDFQNDDKAAQRAASDHRPVWAEFHTGQDDD